MPRVGIWLTLAACALASPALKAESGCALAPGMQALLERHGSISDTTCDPARFDGNRYTKADDELMRKVGKWKLTLLDVGTRNRTRVTLNHKDLRLKVTL